MKTRSKPLERYRSSEQGANRSKRMKEVENKEQTARMGFEKIRTRSKLLERD